MPRPSKSHDRRIYQLKVTLRWTKPPIWRRFLVRADTSLADLHDILQRVMGWEDCHLHQFRAGGKTYRIPFDGDFDEVLRESQFSLAEVAPRPKCKFNYEYDFGDGWEHTILVEDILEPDSFVVPQCLKGKGACPPEDCGGIGGYYNMLEALADPKHEDHAMYADWTGGSFDADAFDADAVNNLLMPKKVRIWQKKLIG